LVAYDLLVDIDIPSLIQWSDSYPSSIERFNKSLREEIEQ